MNIPALSPAAAGSPAPSSGAARFADNPFLAVLVAQLRAQTPLEPVNNDSFMQQMGMLSNLEEQRQLNAGLMDLLGFQGALARMEGLGRAAALLGREVEFREGSGETTERGVVEAVRLDGRGRVVLQVEGRDVPLDAVVGVRDAAGEGT